MFDIQTNMENWNSVSKKCFLYNMNSMNFCLRDIQTDMLNWNRIFKTLFIYNMNKIVVLP